MLGHITSHPLNRSRRVQAVSAFLGWQLSKLLHVNKSAVPWVEDARLLIGKGEAGLTGNLYCGLMEFEDMAFLLHFLRSDSDFFDIGANAGAFTVLASKVVGSRSYPVEPIPETYERLIDQIKLNRIDELVTPRNCGLGETEGLLAFTTTLDCTNTVNTDPYNDDVINVPVMTLDSICDPVADTLLKIDVEGYEYFVLQGGVGVLSNPNVKALIIELNGSGEKFGVHDKEIDAFLRNMNFKPVSYNPTKRELSSISVANAEGNTIYVKDIQEASKLCKGAPEFSIHTADGTKI